MHASDSIADKQCADQGTSRRTVVQGAAWAVPVIAASVVVPTAAASTTVPREFTIQSNFGSGWYPRAVNSTNSGVVQFDTASNDKWFYVEGTQAGDVLTNISVSYRVSVNWPELHFQALPGSNPLWTTPVMAGTETLDGITYRVYSMTYTGTITATGSRTDVPIGFYFRSQSLPYVANGYARTSRYITVNGQPVELTRGVSNIVNTNVTTPPAP